MSENPPSLWDEDDDLELPPALPPGTTAHAPGASDDGEVARFLAGGRMRVGEMPAELEEALGFRVIEPALAPPPTFDANESEARLAGEEVVEARLGSLDRINPREVPLDVLRALCEQTEGVDAGRCWSAWIEREPEVAAEALTVGRPAAIELIDAGARTRLLGTEWVRMLAAEVGRGSPMARAMVAAHPGLRQLLAAVPLPTTASRRGR